MVEDIEYDDVIKCDHVTDKKCHTTFSTNYQSVQEEECQDTFKKNCVFEYEHVVNFLPLYSKARKRCGHYLTPFNAVHTKKCSY